MAGVHYQGLFIGHGGQVLHYQPVLRPVLEDGAVAAVDDEFVRMLGHSFVQVVLDHGHNGRRLPRACRIFVNGPGIDLIGRPIPVHIDASIGLQLGRKFRR